MLRFTKVDLRKVTNYNLFLNQGFNIVFSGTQSTFKNKIGLIFIIKNITELQAYTIYFDI